MCKIKLDETMVDIYYNIQSTLKVSLSTHYTVNYYRVNSHITNNSIYNIHHIKQGLIYVSFIIQALEGLLDCCD